ncbi:MAG: class I SAM-dependent methyltransferase [Acidimicrobiales bacterium]
MAPAAELDTVRAPGTSGAARTEPLRARWPATRPPSGVAAAAARTALVTLLDRGACDRFELIHPDRTVTVHGPSEILDLRSRTGPDSGAGRDTGAADRPDGTGLTARIVIDDARTWTAVASGGSSGLGRAYIDGWWTSDDLTTVLRALTRSLEPLDEIRNRVTRITAPVTDRLRRLRPGPTRRTNRLDIASHYDLSNDFFALFLDETMTYSAGVFPSPTATMADASRAKYDRLIDKLGVTADHHILEVGTGWGGFALRAASRVGCRVTTTTISAEQYREATARIAAAGLSDQVTVLATDWRDLRGRYDRVVAIEMIEAVHWRHYDSFFQALGERLDPHGLLGLQAICVPEWRYRRTRTTEDFIRRYVFPGGCLPSIGTITTEAAGSARLQTIDVDDLTAHYAETLDRWTRRFEEHWDTMEGLGLDERFRRLWRFYLAYCSAAFIERHCTLNQVILAGPRWRPAGLALRPC